MTPQLIYDNLQEAIRHKDPILFRQCCANAGVPWQEDITTSYRDLYEYRRFLVQGISNLYIIWPVCRERG